MAADLLKPDPNAALALVLALRLKGAAKALNVSDRTLWDWTNKGDVPHIRRNGTILYPVDALRRWLDEQAAKATSTSTSTSTATADGK